MAAPTPERKFGPLVIEKQLPRSTALLLAPVALAFLWLSLSAGPPSLETLPVLLLALGLLALVAWTLTYRARIHDQGVVAGSLFGQRELHFRDLHTFAYSRVSRAGQVTDTLSFIPRTGKPVRVTTQPRGGQDADLARIVEALTTRGRTRMEQELARGRQVRWLTEMPGALPGTPKVSLSREGVLLEDRSGTASLPFAAVDARVTNGSFLLVEHASGKTRLNVPCLSPNFYPGLALFERLRQPAPAAAHEAQPSA